MNWRGKLVKKKVIIEGQFHFVESFMDSGREIPPDKTMHFSTYVRPDLISTTGGLLDELGREFANRLNPSVDYIVAVGMESIALGTATATQIDLPFCFLSTNDFSLRKDFLAAVRGAKIALVSNTLFGSTITTRAIKTMKSAKGEVVQVLSVWDHTDGVLKVKPPISSLITEAAKRWTLEGCLSHGPCSKGVPIKRNPAAGGDLEDMYLAGLVQLPEGAELKFID